MAVMASGDRDICAQQLMKELSRLFSQLGGCLKADLRAAVDATDQWISDNQASFNTALPLAFRNNASATQKTLVFMIVLVRRNLLGT